MREIRTTNCLVTGKVSSSRYVPYKGAGTYAQTLEHLSQSWSCVAPRCTLDKKLNANVLSAQPKVQTPLDDLVFMLAPRS